MNRTLDIIRDGETLLRFTRSSGVPALQRRQFDALDRRLDAGIELEGEHIASPDPQQRVHFVIGLLLDALRRGDMTATRGLCAWLSQRLPALRAIRIEAREGDLEVALDYDAGMASDV